MCMLQADAAAGGALHTIESVYQRKIPPWWCKVRENILGFNQQWRKDTRQIYCDRQSARLIFHNTTPRK